MSQSIRQLHRWVSMVFTATVILGFLTAALSLPEWIFYLPLPPLFVLLGTGLYLFVLPYLARRRGQAARG